MILIGNKIDLRQGQVTNQALEEEILPIMQEFKEVEVSELHTPALALNPADQGGAPLADVCRMLGQDPAERVRSLLLRSKRSFASNGSVI